MKRTKRPYGDPTSKRRSVTINGPDWQKLKTLGNGNASAGIREALASRGRISGAPQAQELE